MNTDEEQLRHSLQQARSALGVGSDGQFLPHHVAHNGVDGPLCMADGDFCGCCGREIESSPSKLWCSTCDHHVLQAGDIWERTWFAQFGEACPYE